jgi:hypothetical protein
MHQEIISSTIKVANQTKAMHDHLKSTKQFLQMIMELSGIVCEVS